VGPDGGRIIGEALFENHTLKTLLLDNNNIDATACFIICVAIQFNYSITRLSIDGNPIGEIGAKALMNIPATVGARVNLSANNCNVMFRSKENSWFDEEDPCGTYTLNMTDSFSRAVAFKILSIAANHYSYEIRKCLFYDKIDTKEKDKKVINLKQIVNRDRIRFMTKKEKKILQNLIKIRDSSKDDENLEALFYEYDINKSNNLQLFEFKFLLDDIGMPLSDSQLVKAFNFIDSDISGIVSSYNIT
jgi:hypothetical protein